MDDCGCHPVASTKTERNVLIVALTLNVTMFVIGLTAGILAQSTALIADSFDMLADALAYSLGLFAIGRKIHLKKIIAKLSGGLLLLLGMGVLLDVGCRAWLGSFPDSTIVIATASLSLIVNTIVLRLLRAFRKGEVEVHLRATWIFTRADVIANLGVIISGVLVILTKSRYPDLIVGFAIGLYLIKEAIAIFRESLKTIE